MRTLRNHVQLIGYVGHKPQIITLENGNKFARFSMATNEFYKNAKGENKQSTQWHTVVAWGRLADIAEEYVEKGNEIGVSGKLKSRKYKNQDGKKYTTVEVIADEILLLGIKRDTGDS